MVLKNLEIAIITKDNQGKEEKRIRGWIKWWIIKLGWIIGTRKIKLKTK